MFTMCLQSLYIKGLQRKQKCDTIYVMTAYTTKQKIEYYVEEAGVFVVAVSISAPSTKYSKINHA